MGGRVVMPFGIVDSHVHFWDPAELHYPWLDAVPALRRPFLPSDYAAAARDAPIAGIVFVEGNCHPDEAGREVALAERLAQAEPRLAGIVAFLDLTDPDTLDRRLDALARSPRVAGVRHNIQGQPAGWCRQRAFVEGVRRVGSRGLTFDLCATHDQLADVIALVDGCPDTRFVLDHCGKPAIRERLLKPWSEELTRLAGHGNVYCKLSGLLTAASDQWCEDDLLPYAAHAIESFGPERLLYGSDWPVLTLAGAYRDWYGFTERLTAGWSAAARRGFYCGNATRVYGL
jgi:L-fuconolactonase